MPSLSDYKPSENLCILLLGAPKTGKTIAAAHFPNPYILDVDNNLGGPTRWIRKNRPAIAATIGYDTVARKNGAEVPPQDQWIRAIDLLGAAIKDPKYSTIIIDSMTTLDGALCAHILNSDDGAKYRSGKAKMQIQHYGEFHRLMTAFIMQLNRCGKTVIFIAHEEVEDGELDPKGDPKVYRPALSGRLKHTIGALMTDVWRTEVEQVGLSNYEFKIRVKPTARHKLGTSLDLPACFVFDYPTIEKAINA